MYKPPHSTQSELTSLSAILSSDVKGYLEFENFLIWSHLIRQLTKYISYRNFILKN